MLCSVLLRSSTFLLFPPGSNNVVRKDVKQVTGSNSCRPDVTLIWPLLQLSDEKQIALTDTQRERERGEQNR